MTRTRLALLAVLFAFAADADQFRRFQRNTTKPLAFFEFAPASGAGLGPACACAAVTGAKGEAVTWTRGSTATCTKSASESSIANGDLVQCASNLPRVMSLGGPLGVLVESSRTNNLVQSEAFDNAAWSTENTGSTAPVIAADAATSPANTATADRVTFAATAAAQDSMKFIGGGCANPCTLSVYAKGVSGSGTFDICTSGNLCGTCNYTTAWGRCSVTLAGAGFAAFGNMTVYNGGTTRPSNDVYLWGAQGETATYATSYIPTTTVAVTRAADPQPNVTMAGAVGPTMCLAATILPTGSTASVFASLGTVAPNFASLGWASDTTASFVLNATTATPTVSSIGMLTPHRAWLQDIAGVRTAKWDGATVAAPAASMGAGSSTLVLGSSTLNGIISRVQADNSPGACTP